MLGGWVQTASGRRLWPLSPCEGDVVLEDIAHHLAQLVRFNGATPLPYSVAQHSMLVSERAEALAVGRGLTPEAVLVVALQGLLHDAAEYVLGDVVRPLKAQLSVPEMGVELKDLEGAWLSCILSRFRLPTHLHAYVLEADEDVLATEAWHLFPEAKRPSEWSLAGEVILGMELEFQYPLDFAPARAAFLTRFRELGGRMPGGGMPGGGMPGRSTPPGSR